MRKPEEITAIYDNSGTDNETMDCMTFVLGKSRGNLYECLATSYNGVSFSQFSECKKGNHLGRRVTWESINDSLKRHVISRFEEEA